MDSESVDAVGFFVDEKYEFSAPKFFDLLKEETDEEIKEAEMWFKKGKSDDPSPFMMRIKGARFAEIDSVYCDFGDDEKNTTKMDLETLQDTSHPPSHKQTNFPAKQLIEDFPTFTKASSSVTKTPCLDDKEMSTQKSCLIIPELKDVNSLSERRRQVVPGIENSRKVHALKSNGFTKPTYTSKLRKDLLPPKSVNRNGISAAKKSSLKRDISQENQAVKKQKLDSGGTRQIHNVKTSVLHHKSKPHSINMLETTASSIEDSTPFLSVAELIKKYESKTRNFDLTQNHSISHENSIQLKKLRPKLTLTRPKEPNFETTYRVRAVRIKSSAELEQEMLAKIPKFKAKALNKKILEAPSMAPSRSIPQIPQFQEFHLKTTERANLHTESALLESSIDSCCQNHGKITKLTEVKPPLLFTSLRARPPRIKPSWEMEMEELAKVPKFKAKPLNKRMFERKRDVTLPCDPTKGLTIPQEFNFATNERLGLPSSAASTVDDLFEKLSIQSECNQRVNPYPKRTLPNPFNLHTEERGLQKEKRLQEQLRWKQIEEEKNLIPKSNPYPYTTDYPVIPPKPDPKPCTKAEVFQLKSLIRHEEIVQRMIEEKERLEREDAERRSFKAQPVMKEDPNPLPEKERKPLTEIQEFALRVDHRAGDRAEFDKKIKEREMLYKRERDEYDHATMVEEDKSLKRMRKKMVPHARPVPSFANPFIPQKVARELTRPKSPKLLVDERSKRYLR